MVTVRAQAVINLDSSRILWSLLLHYFCVIIGLCGLFRLLTSQRSGHYKRLQSNTNITKHIGTEEFKKIKKKHLPHFLNHSSRDKIVAFTENHRYRVKNCVMNIKCKMLGEIWQKYNLCIGTKPVSHKYWKVEFI